MDEYLDQTEAYLETLPTAAYSAAPAAAPTDKMDTTVSRTTTVGASLFDTLQILLLLKRECHCL